MRYAELLKHWRAGSLPVRTLAGTRREATQASNGGNLPALPTLPGTEIEGEQKPKIGMKPYSAKESKPVLALVRCGQCHHFKPNTKNPEQGLGRCEAGAEGEHLPYPLAPRRCATWRPTPSALLEICRAACAGLELKPEKLAQWLVGQNDAQWMTPPAANWWAHFIKLNGYPKP